MGLPGAQFPTSECRPSLPVLVSHHLTRMMAELINSDKFVSRSNRSRKRHFKIALLLLWDCTAGGLASAVNSQMARPSGSAKRYTSQLHKMHNRGIGRSGLYFPCTPLYPLERPLVHPCVIINLQTPRTGVQNRFLPVYIMHVRALIS
jgi:hypothetical protein